MSWIQKSEIEAWNNGAFATSYCRMGAHPVKGGTWFALWAPHAERISVVGDFNHWSPGANTLERKEGGLWELFIEGVQAGARYKFRIERGSYAVDKTDPYAFALEAPSHQGSPTAGLASIVTDRRYDWHDHEWMSTRTGPATLNEPVSIYEVHLGSWKKKPDGYSFSYREIAEPLADHVERLGFTHVELMPVMEHPYYGSWGYQVVGYYAPTFRYGSPDDLKYLIDYLHQRGIGVLLDWVPAHFATDPQGLVFFDGSTLYEYDDPNMRYHPDWGTYVFDYHKPGVKSFLVSNAVYWLKEFHIDGLRFDAVASMLYRDYSRTNWSPNMFGGRENLEAIDFLKQVNESVYREVPDAIMAAEESTAWPGVSQPTYNGGLGFLYKWNMGWMHDTLQYMGKDPVHRRFHHDDLTFPLVYAFSEHFVLPLSHDEVVHGKGSLWQRMPGDDWQKAANMRLLYAHMVGHPGKKLIFMGSEFGQRGEWDHDGQLDWQDMENPVQAGIMRWVEDIFKLYRERPCLWNDAPKGFEWIDFGDQQNSVVSYLRKSDDDELIFVANFTPVPRENYRVGVTAEGVWRERLNSDSDTYGGSGVGNLGGVESSPVPYQGRPASVVLTVPPLSMLILERETD
jgi:1,4-alpha-glucan branching enzyme